MRRKVGKAARRAKVVDTVADRLTVTQALESRALCKVVLEDCINTLLRPYQRLSIVNTRPFLVPLKARAHTMREWTRRRDELLVELVQAEIDWVRADDREAPWSFVRCCEVLNLDPDAVRWRLHQRGLLGKPAEMVAAGHLRAKTRLTGTR